MKTQQENIFSSKTLTYFLQLAETMSYTQAAQILGSPNFGIDSTNKEIRANGRSTTILFSW